MHVWLLYWTVFWLTTVFISSSKHFDVLIFVVVLVSRLMAELSFLFIVTFSGCVTSQLDIVMFLSRWRNSAPTFLPASRNFILNSSVSASQALS